MISKYNNFLLEYKLLNENLNCSNDFIERLNTMVSRENRVAKVLRDIFHQEMGWRPIGLENLPQNYIDLADQDDKITFLADNRFQRLNDANPDVDPYLTSGRGNIGVGRFVRSILRNEVMLSKANREVLRQIPEGGFTDRDFEAFVNLYKSLYEKPGSEMRMVEGSEIKKFYHYDSYASEQGQLGNSCMRYDRCQEFLGVYTDNSSCKLLVLLDEKSMVWGRALVWKLTKSPCEAQYFMDRVYCSRDSDVLKFTEMAEREGWMYKWKMNSDSVSNIIFIYGGQPVVGLVEIKLDNANFSDYPFMDTISYIDLENKTAHNVNGKGRIECGDTNGGHSSCYLCGGTGLASGDCPQCYSTGFEDCEECNGNGDKKCQTCHGSGTTGNQIECPDCKGSGRVMKKVRMGKCFNCDATGKVREDCPDCNGSGLIPCSVCDGTGRQDCKMCGGDGKLSETRCPECVGDYKEMLEYNKAVGNPQIKAMVQAELDKLST
jgi:hypothetical protein